MEVTLEAAARTETGKGPARRARAAGKVPAVLYGPSVQPTSLVVDSKQMIQALQTEAGANVLINLAVDGSRYLTVPREIQKHPIKGTILHVDFVQVARDVKINADVPVHFVGESRGVKEGGQLDVHLHELKVEALPTDVPAAIEVDISGLGIGDPLKVSDVVLPAGVEVVNPPEDLVVAIIETTVMEVEEEVAPEEGEELPEAGEPAEAEGEG
ncbi:MAG: 50S ribosomal protein L25/general stress protein Ctc [Actinomycetota bacterium]|nr:50S ribosomal protein L25/general stress protein Ctc [Actinomycetota bacterium]